MQNHFSFTKATSDDHPAIWTILQQSIRRRKLDGSQQWQDGYPNENSVSTDLEKGWAYKIESEGTICAYAALIFDGEPEYEKIQGKWLSDLPYLVLHRVAVSDEFIGQGLGKKIFQEAEKVALANEVRSIRVDTNFDNAAMLKILEDLGYTYCGEVYFRGSARRAYEKILPEK